MDMQITKNMADREIVTTRLFHHPCERVFRAWTEPDHLARWWGPKGFTNTFEEFNPKPGGAWKFVMHGPDGTDYHNKSVFVEIIKPEKIVFDHLMPMHRFRVTTTFTEEAGRTRVTFRMRFETAEECERIKAYVVTANEENFDRLEAELARMKQ